MRLRRIIFSWDFILSIILGIIAYFLLPDIINSSNAEDLYNVGVTTLALVFSIYFASLAFILASGDDKFIKFLEEEGHYTELISTYKYTMIVLFLALVISLVLLVFNLFIIDEIHAPINSKYVLVIYFSFSFYGLACVANSAMDSIEYAKFRIKYLMK